jgi:hypothetical protein
VQTVLIGQTELFLPAFGVDIGEEHVKAWRWYWYMRGVVHLKNHYQSRRAHLASSGKDD